MIKPTHLLLLILIGILSFGGTFSDWSCSSSNGRVDYTDKDDANK